MPQAGRVPTASSPPSQEGELTPSSLPAGLAGWFTSPKQKKPLLLGWFSAVLAVSSVRWQPGAGAAGAPGHEWDGEGLGAAACPSSSEQSGRLSCLETSHCLQTTEEQQASYGNCYRSVRFLSEINEFYFFLSMAVLGTREVQKLGSGRGLRSSFGLIPFQYRVAVSLSSQMLPSLLSRLWLEFVGFLFFPKEKKTRLKKSMVMVEGNLPLFSSWSG